jgi:hypothetical protein
MAQEGFLYEANVAKCLQDYGLVKKNYVPAGASSDRPDLDLFIKGVEYGCELKKDLASAGSLVIKYNNASASFSFGETGGAKEKEFMKGLGVTNKVLDAIKSKWKKKLWIAEDRDEKWIKRWEDAGQPNVKERYNQDLKNCPDIFFDLPSDTIEKYYNLKDTYYLNVGTHGFFLLGQKDPAKMNIKTTPKIPRWSNAHRAVLRIRIQSKGVTKALAQEKSLKRPTGGQGYQITMEIQFKSVAKSPYNIGPVSKGSASIIKGLVKLP